MDWQDRWSGTCPGNLPNPDELPPRESDSGPDRNIRQRSNESRLPPLPERHIVGGVEHGSRGSPVMRQAGREIREAGEGEDAQPQWSALGSQYDHKRSEHRQNVSRDAGEAVVGIKIDRQRNRE